MAKIHLGDIGTVLEVTVKNSETKAAEPINTATIKQILIRSPSGVTKTNTAEFKTDGTDGVLQYTTIADDLDEQGVWELQAYVVTPTFTNHSSIDTFVVSGNL